MTDFVLRDAAVIVGAGPAGLMAASVLAEAGKKVHVFDAMPSVGRKFLLAGKGGLNLTHSEPEPGFSSRYGSRSALMSKVLHDFDAAAVRRWSEELGVETFIGTSGRVFPKDMKAAPLLRAWLHRLRGQGVQFHMRHRCTGWDEQGALVFQAPDGPCHVTAGATVLALGGASWPRLGSDGSWVPWLAEHGVVAATLQPSNCGFDVLSRGQVGWTSHFAQRHAGQAFKLVAIRARDSLGTEFHRKGEFVATATGVEGSLIYAASAMLRDEIARQGQAQIHVDLLPDRSPEQVLKEVAHPRGSRSLSSHLKSRLALDGVKMALLHEVLTHEQMADPKALAQAIKAVPVCLNAARPMAEAISTAGGVRFEDLSSQLMIQQMPGVFCAGEMLDWEAPTGGYLLTACMATGRRAGSGALQWLKQSAAS